MGRLGTELPVAPWHRGLPLSQIRAACDLQTALSLDLEEETTHRVKDCLMRLGLCGQLDFCLLHKTMQLSRGNNLAFLYFLYTMQYESEYPHKKYTLNEQIILSAIAYLDMPATIEALDKILPMARKRMKTQPAKPYPSERSGKVDTTQDAKMLPYFEKQHKPKLRHRHLQSAPAHFAVSIPNEFKESLQPENRWFADYGFQPAKRIVKSVISEEIVKLFDRIDEFRGVPETEPLDMCEFHQKSRSLERAAYLERQRQQCLSMIDLDEERKLLTRRRIAKQVQLDVQKYMQKFDDHRWSRGVPAFRQIGCTACRLLGPTPLPVMVMAGVGEGHHQWSKMSADGSSEQVLRLGGGQESRPPTPSLNYFQGTKLHAPYIFDYFRLLGRYSQMSLSAGECIDGAVLKALDDVDDREKQRPIMVTRWHISDAVNQCVWRIYEKSLMAVKNSENPKERLSYGENKHFDPDDEVFMDRMLEDAFKALQKNRKLVLPTLCHGHQVPELREWIRRRYGKRYTAATRSELRQSQFTTMHLTKMHHELYTSLMGQHQESKQQSSISCARYDLLLARAQKFRLCFKERVNEIVMERTRLCWRAMNYLRTKNYTSLQQTFFSYLPGSACETVPIFTTTKNVNGKCGRSLGK
ncbi:uncharacterized protein DMAD_11188 [Drosophila madeirensis]|uniref:Uncharacterized protein n=1 Tax=Drosophila madeirensis TaxID=30013 RepID=A0AAU9FCG9_DROMD